HPCSASPTGSRSCTRAWSTRWGRPTRSAIRRTPSCSSSSPDRPQGPWKPRGFDMKERSLELKVGLLVLVAAGVLGAFIFFLGSFSLAKGYRLFVDFNFAGNVQKGAPVKVSGIKVGKIDEIQFLGGALDEKTGRRVQVRVGLWVEERAKDAIRENAEFFVSTAGVLGEQYIEIVPGTHDKPALAPDSIVVGVDPARTDLIIARLYELLDSATSIVRDDKDVIRNMLKNAAGAAASANEILSDNREELKHLIA